MKNTSVVNPDFKVPKIKHKEYLENISLSSTQYQTEILANVVSNFKKPEISEKKFNITSAWLINNQSAEERYVKRRLIMKKEKSKLSCSVGFMYIRNFKTLEDIARSGRIEVGNINNSHLGKSTMGVSVCLYADIYHPGFNLAGVPEKGYLLLVKYLKGKIKYVPCDDLSMDPQPNYDCHMVKSPKINANVSCETAYHQSQIFIYEYTDDGDIVRYPSKLLPFAAVQFNWIGSPIFKFNSSPFEKTKVIKDNRVQELKNIHNERHVTTFSVHKKNASSIVEFDLTIRGLKGNKLRSNAFLYFTHPILSLFKSDCCWEMSGVIECSQFQKDFKHIQVAWTSRGPQNFNEPIFQDIIISLNRPNLLRSVDIDNKATFFTDFSNIPQFVSYIRVIIEDYQHSKRLIKFLNLTKTMGFINRPNEPDISILLFPDGKLSKKFGFPSFPNIYYLHGLVFHSQSPQFILRNNVPENRKEKSIYFSSLTSYKKRIIHSKFKSFQPLINLRIFKQTIKAQAEVQKRYLFKILKPQYCYMPIDYKPICFTILCVDYECKYHYSAKRMRLQESVDKENIEDPMQTSSPLNMTIKIKPRHCLNEKLLDYFKSYKEYKSDIGDNEEVQEDYKNKTIVTKYFNSWSNSKDVIKDETSPLEVTKVARSTYFSTRPSMTLEKFTKQKNRETFLPLEFFGYNNARYFDNTLYRTINFDNSNSDFKCDSSEILMAKLWSLNQNLFKKNSNFPGICFYD